MTHLNMQIIEELREVLGEDLDPIASAFLDGLTAQIDELLTCFQTSDLSALTPIVHAFKGGTANMGAAALAERAAAIERHAKAGERAEVAALLDELPELGLQTLAAYRELGFAAGD